MRRAISAEGLRDRDCDSKSGGDLEWVAHTVAFAPHTSLLRNQPSASIDSDVASGRWA
jgi:hypothetical protein